MITCLAGIVALAFAIVSHGLSARRQPGGCWGEERVAIGATGDGAYRSAPIHATRARPAPRRVTLAAISARLWAALTALLFAPAGLLAVLPLFFLATRHTQQGVLVGGALGVVVSGLGLSAALARAATKLERRDTTGLDRTLGWSLAHHAAVALIALAASACVSPGMFTAAIATVVPLCLVGVAVTGLLAYASARVPASSDPHRVTR